MKIKAGTTKMKVDPKTGQRKGWHTFQCDTLYKVEYRQSICQTVLVVKKGSDKGLYAGS